MRGFVVLRSVRLFGFKISQESIHKRIKVVLVFFIKLLNILNTTN